MFLSLKSKDSLTVAHLKKITEGIYQVEGVNCNVYLVEDGDKLILIDTGLPRSDKKIVKAIEELGRKPNNVSTIVITHFHIDHVGSLKKMKTLTGAKVAVHKADTDYVSGKQSPPKPKNLMLKALTSVVKAAPVDTEIVLEEGDKVGRLVVIHTPGHSDGSISLLDAERKVMFVGDAVRFMDGKLEGAPPRFTLDAAKAKDSIGKIATFDFDIMLSGHGEPLMEKASQKIREFSAASK
jgi:glyoxylase-like metal-dependent hydrolase (beta-lactamase superfamily II)